MSCYLQRVVQSILIFGMFIMFIAYCITISTGIILPKEEDRWLCMALITTDIKIDAHNKAELKLRNGNCMEIVQYYSIAGYTGNTYITPGPS